MYYMKIKISSAFFLLSLLFIPGLCPAQVTVVRVDGPKVYIDISALNRNVQKGETFKIILSSERLINPKTGKDLGPVYTYSPEGKITEVQPLYAVGELPQGVKVSVGQETVLETLSAPAPRPAQTQNAPAQKPAFTHKTVSYAPVEQTIISLTAADITGDGKEEIATLSDKGLVTVWQPANAALTPLYTWQLKNKEAVTLSAADVKKSGRAQIFLTAYESGRAQISSSVLELKDGQLTLTDTLPYFVKELGCAENKKIWTQKPFVIGANPGTARLLAYDGKRFYTAEERLDTQRNWLTGVNAFDMENSGKRNLIYTSSNGRIRMVTARGKRAESKDLFASTPNRVQYKQDILKFYPSVQAYGENDGAVLAAVENVSKQGLLSDTFGSYKNAQIHFMRFEKGGLQITDSVPLEGFVYDTACSAHSVLAAEVLPDGTSGVVEIFR